MVVLVLGVLQVVMVLPIISRRRGRREKTEGLSSSLLSKTKPLVLDATCAALCVRQHPRACDASRPSAVHMRLVSPPPSTPCVYWASTNGRGALDGVRSAKAARTELDGLVY